MASFAETTPHPGLAETNVLTAAFPGKSLKTRASNYSDPSICRTPLGTSDFTRQSCQLIKAPRTDPGL